MLLLLLLLGACTFANAEDGWTGGRATYYDDNTQGSCRYGTRIPTLYAAWPDSQDGFPACGECYEVACVNRNFQDGYGKSLQRSNACKDESATVTVKIVDSCPCVHSNYYSNQRWCCGDMAHIDLGREAFKQLASEKQGVVGAKWRKVSCPDGDEAAPSSESYARAEATASADSSDDSSSSNNNNSEKPSKRSKQGARASSKSSSSASSGFSWSSWFGK